MQIGDSREDVAKALDSCYLAYQSYLQNHLQSIDHTTITRGCMLRYAGPSSTDTPDQFNKDYRRYYATLIISEELATDKVELYFWRDTLHKIHVSNSDSKTRDIAKAMIYRYGDGEGFYNKTADRENQRHIWGNDRVIAQYKGDIRYCLNNSGIVSSIDRMFQDITITLNNPDMSRRIDEYLHEADSLWRQSKYNGI